MKRILLSMVGMIALMAIIFTGTSCGGSSVPKEPGNYISFGKSFQKISKEQMVYVDSWNGVSPKEFAEKAILIPSGCTTIKYGCRLNPTEAQTALAGGIVAEIDFRKTSLESVITKIAVSRLEETGITSGPESRTIYASGATTDESKYENGNTYILLTFELPASPEGKYLFHLYGGTEGGMGGTIALQRK